MTSHDSKKASPSVVDVIIPVYKGFQETLACIRHVQKAVNVTPVQIVVIDDASPDADLRHALDQQAAEGKILLLKNTANLGYVRSVNRGLALHPDRDVILLNADTRPHGDWVDRMVRTASSRENIGAVTPLSNNATILSYPTFCQSNDLSEIDDPLTLDALCADCFPGAWAEIPTAIGYCMLIKRSCLEDVGYFNEHLFDQGYAEENEFSLRSRGMGWIHAAALDVYVYHCGNISFGKFSTKLQINLMKLSKLFPHYDALIDSYKQSDPLLPVRRELDARRLMGRGGITTVLMTTDLDGGTKRFVEENRERIRRSGERVAILFSQKDCEGKKVRFDIDAEDFPNLEYRLPEDLDLLKKDFQRFGVKRVQIHHFLNYDESIFEAILAADPIIESYIHDYVWFCPRINCIDHKNTYCGEPGLADCEKCIVKNGTRFENDIDLKEYLSRNRRLLENSSAIIAPSTDAATRIQHHFGELNISVIPHPEPDFNYPAKITNHSGPVTKVLLIGAIGDHKGYEILYQMACDAYKRDLPLEFVVVGYTRDDPLLFSTKKAFITGKYAEEEALEIISMQKASMALFLSVWPETWCYALTLAWRAGVWPIGFDIGAVGERIRNSKSGSLLPLGTPPHEINDFLLHFVNGVGQDGSFGPG